MAKFYKPQNEKGHDLVPVDETNLTGKHIDISWFDTVSGAISTDDSDDNKVVLGSAVTATIEALESKLRTDIQGIKFEVVTGDLKGLKDKYTNKLKDANDNAEELAEIRQELGSTIFFIPSVSGEDNSYIEYVCTNAQDVSKTADPRWEKIGETVQAVPQATEERLGTVKLTDEVGEGTNEVSNGIAVTPKAVKDAIDNALGGEEISNKLESITIKDSANGQAELTVDNTELTIKGTSHITVAIADNAVTISDTITNATTSAAGIVQLVNEVEDDTDETKAVTPKAVKDYVDNAFTEADIESKIDAAIEKAVDEGDIGNAIDNAIEEAKGELKGELETDIKTAKDAAETAQKAAEDAQDTADEAKKLAGKAYETVYLKNQTITKGQVELTVDDRDQKFIAAFIKGALFIPEVTVADETITIAFCKEDDTATQSDLGTSADILISQLVTED